MTHTDRLLVLRLSAMGDVAMTVPVVYSLARQYPHLEITVVSRPFAAHFFGNLLPNITFMAVDTKGEHKGIAGLNRLYNQLKPLGFSYVADLHDVLRTQFLRTRFLIAGKKVAHIDKHRLAKRRLTDPRRKHLQQLPSAFDNYADVFSRLGYPVRLEFTSLYGEGKGDFSLIAQHIAAKSDGERWYGIAPFAAHKGKIYPIERLRQVVDLLLDSDPRCRLFFFGSGESEHQAIAKMADGRQRCTDASKTLHGLKEELVLMSHLDTMLSMDSSNQHLASLVGTRVVSVWGATHVSAGFLGWQQSRADVVERQDECRPCSIYGNRECRFGDYHCLDIAPETIVAAIVGTPR